MVQRARLRCQARGWIVDVWHAAISGARLSCSSLHHHRRDPVAAFSSVPRDRRRRLGIRLRRRISDLRSGAKLRRRLLRDDLFARLGDRRLGLDRRPRREHDGVGSAHGGNRTLAPRQAMAFCARHRCGLGPDRRYRRFARGGVCATHAAVAADRTRAGAKPRKRHGCIGASDFGEPWPSVADAGADCRDGHSRRRLEQGRAVRPAAGDLTGGIQRRLCAVPIRHRSHLAAGDRSTVERTATLRGSKPPDPRSHSFSPPRSRFCC